MPMPMHHAHAPCTMQVALTARSRANEFEADRYSVETYGEAEALVGPPNKLPPYNPTPAPTPDP